MNETVEMQKLDDLVEVRKSWVPVETAQAVLDYYLGFPPNSEFWSFYSNDGIPKAQRGLGSPLVHWHGFKFLRDSSLEPAAGETPQFVTELLARANTEFGLNANQVQVNLYEPGYGLAWHSDKNKRKPLKDNKTVTVTISEPEVEKMFVVAPRPVEWGVRKFMQDIDEPMDLIEPTSSWTLRTGDCTVYDKQLHEDGVHAVLPTPGIRLGITFRSL